VEVDLRLLFDLTRPGRWLVRLALLALVLTQLALGAAAQATDPAPVKGLLLPEDVDEEAVFPSQARASHWFPPDERYEDFAEAPDRRFIYIWQDRQMMYLFQDGEVVRIIPTSTGLPDPKTVTKPWSGRVGKYWGTFFAYDVYADEAWHLFKDDGNILIHSAPYTKEGEKKVYQDLGDLGVRPMSHGCIRIPPADAAWLTAWGPQGVPVLITPLTMDRDG